MAQTGLKQKLKEVDLMIATHKKWMELDHIAREFKQAIHTANGGYIAQTQEMTPRMKEIWYRYIAWCVKHYGKKA